MIIGYTTGVYDLFHIGHLNLLRRAKEHCDELIVGVATDELTESLKNISPIVPFSERCEIIEALKCVDRVVPYDVADRIAAWKKHQFTIMFKGDDWKGTPQGAALEKQMAVVGVKIVYFPYTESTSSTRLRQYLDWVLQDNGSAVLGNAQK